MKPKKNDFMERLSSPNSALATPPVETITLPSQAPNARGAFYDAAGNLLTYSQFKDIKDQECADRRGAMAKKKEEDKQAWLQARIEKIAEKTAEALIPEAVSEVVSLKEGGNKMGGIGELYVSPHPHPTAL